MLTFMNSKLTKMTGKDKQNHIFQKSKSYEISSTVIYIYILVRTGNLLFMYFTGVSHQTMKFVLNVKKHLSNLIKGHNICSGIKNQRVIFVRIPLFYFIESLLTIHVLLIDKRRVFLKLPNTDPPTTFHLSTDPPNTYPPTHRLVFSNLR